MSSKKFLPFRVYKLIYFFNLCQAVILGPGFDTSFRNGHLSTFPVKILIVATDTGLIPSAEEESASQINSTIDFAPFV
jgi:hypothetical protein